MRSVNAATAIDPAEAVLNQSLLGQYRQRKTGLLERLIAAYLEEAPQFFQKIRGAAESNNFDEMKLNAHALKSCSNNLGATRLAKICQAIEDAASARNGDDVTFFMEKIGLESFEAEQALKGELYALKRPALQ